MVDLNDSVLLVALLIGLLVCLVPAIFFLITQQNTLKAIQPQNRSMSPGEVWLQLIPLFGIVWQFIVVSRISTSIGAELASRNSFSFENPQYAQGYEGGERPTYQIGIAYCVLFCCSIIPILGTLTGIAGIICWIIYWVKLSEYKNLMYSKNHLDTPVTTQ